MVRLRWGAFIDPRLEDQLRTILPTKAEFYWTGSALGFRIYLTQRQIKSIIAALRRMKINWDFSDWCGRVHDNRTTDKKAPVENFLALVRGQN